MTKIVAAYASSFSDGRDRWTDLTVEHNPDRDDGKVWCARSEAKSNRPGEVTKTRTLRSRDLDRALTLFEDSDLGVIVKAEAREFAEDLVPEQPPAGEKAALAWLYGVEEDRLSVNRAASDLGVGESAIRMQINRGKPIGVPLRALLPFVNRRAFQKAMKERGE